jgi:pyridoxine 4-dehydrogenase
MAQAHSAPAPGGSFQLAGRLVARIGYGAMQLEHLHADPDAAVVLARHAFDHGVTHVDTAEFYGESFVNQVLARALPANNAVAVATKVGAVSNPGGEVSLRPAQRPQELRASVEDNLRTLGREHLELVYLRRLGLGPGIKATGDQVVPLEDQLAEMAALRDEGKIGAIGLSAVDLDGLKAALPVGIAAVQNMYNVLQRSDEPMLELCRREQIAWVPFFPLGSGFPHQPKVADNPIVQRAAAALNFTPAQVGLAWLLQHAENVLLVPGTASRTHLDENLAAGSLELPADTVAELDAARIWPRMDR